MDIAAYIDHTALKSDTTLRDVVQLCKEAVEYNFVAVCVPPFFVAAAKEYIAGSSVKVATVIDFPFGYGGADAKLAAIEQAIIDGADELDMVHCIAAVKSDDWAYLEHEIGVCTQRIHQAGKIIKVIVESGLLTDEELIKACMLYGKHNVDFVKTSTGYAVTGATVHAVSLMQQHLPGHIGIKASGGIRTFAFAGELIAAGATRIGTSSGLAILQQSAAG